MLIRTAIPGKLLSSFFPPLLHKSNSPDPGNHEGFSPPRVPNTTAPLSQAESQQPFCRRGDSETTMSFHCSERRGRPFRCKRRFTSLTLSVNVINFRVVGFTPCPACPLKLGHAGAVGFRIIPCSTWMNKGSINK